MVPSSMRAPFTPELAEGAWWWWAYTLENGPQPDTRRPHPSQMRLMLVLVGGCRLDSPPGFPPWGSALISPYGSAG